MTRHCTDLGGSCLELDDADIDPGIRDDPAYEPEGGPPSWGGPAAVLGVRR